MRNYYSSEFEWLDDEFGSSRNAPPQALHDSTNNSCVKACFH